jgi:uncharacterized protein YndB with AHSA1/START domain
MANVAGPVEVGYEMQMQRTFAAPPERVWKAWTDPREVGRWWGPKGFGCGRCDWEVRPGGQIRIDMLGPGGQVFPMWGEFVLIEEPERLVFRSGAMDDAGQVLFKVEHAVTFAAVGQGTRMRMTARVLEVTPAAAQYLPGMREGWSSSLDCLAEYVSGGTDREIRGVRTYAASRDLVWRMLTEREHVGHWWGPNGFSLTISQMDVRPGGDWIFVMHGPDGTDYANHNVYDVVEAPARLACGTCHRRSTRRLSS